VDFQLGGAEAHLWPRAMVCLIMTLVSREAQSSSFMHMAEIASLEPTVTNHGEGYMQVGTILIFLGSGLMYTLLKTTPSFVWRIRHASTSPESLHLNGISALLLCATASSVLPR
jgi:hypothetical protein